MSENQRRNIIDSLGIGTMGASYIAKEEGKKDDSGKIPCELLSPIALLNTAKVLRFGAQKYAPNNWRKGLSYSRIIGATFRHLFAFMMGEDLDPETGLSHIHHAACELMFLQEFVETRKDLDDRFKIPGNNAGN